MLAAVAVLLLLQAGIDWKTDYKAALTEAQKDGRYVVVFFGAADIPPSQKMKTVTFAHKDVIEWFARKYVCVWVEAEKPNDLAKQLGIETIPTTVVVSSTGERVMKKEGYVGPGFYKSLVSSSVSSHQDLLKLQAKLKGDPENAELLAEIARKYYALDRPRDSAAAWVRAASKQADGKAKAALLSLALNRLAEVDADEELNGSLLAIAAEVEKLDPARLPDAMTARAQVALNREQPAEALALYEEIVAKHPASAKAPSALLGLADLYHHAKKDNKKAIALLERLLKEYPRSDAADDARGMLEHIKAHE